MFYCFAYLIILLYFILFVDNSENEKSAKEFEKQGVIFAESGKMDEALKMFNNAINSSPMWASAYNNRAQALRLLKRNEGLFNNIQHINPFESYITILL
jgi:tetratricopeptide (TPR) repeat protein